MSTKNFMKAAVLSTATKLLKANNTVTTLEIKNQLRKDEPDFYWNQTTVSSIMAELNKEDKFTYVDNGVYRVYSAPTPVKARVTVIPVAIVPAQQTLKVTKSVPKKVTKTVSVPTARISRTKALDLIKNNKGHFFTAVFIKQDGSERTINAQYLKDQTASDLGYVKVREASKMKSSPNDVTRQINLQTLKQLKIAGTQYTIRK